MTIKWGFQGSHKCAMMIMKKEQFEETSIMQHLDILQGIENQ